MDLILDIGNTRIKAAEFIDDIIHQVHVFDQNEFKQMEQLFKLEPDRILISSTNGRVFQMPQNWILSKPITLDNTTPLPIENLYLTPQTLGKDRLAAAVGSAFLWPQKPVLSIDCGTCITFDFINEKGQYLGGAISPGLQMRYQSLHHFTGALPAVNHIEYNHLTGRQTDESILSGVQNGITFEINGQIEAYLAQYPTLQIVLCGGDAKYFVNRLKYKIFADPNLVLIGLHQILKYNDQ